MAMGLNLRFRSLVIAACGAALLGAVPTAAAERVRTLTVSKPAPAGERRTALVIGNGSYKESPLRNPVNDARAMATALTDTGFKVTVIEDARQSTMRRAIREFGDELTRGGVGLFYFAGHGIQIRGRNYLIPVGTDIQREDEVEDQAIDANLVLSKMDSAKNSVNIVILDACRNNPFQRSFRSATRGLAQMDAPSGTMISFATAPGSVAADGDGENGLYTQHLLTTIRQPGLPIEQVFKQVRIGVTRDTADQQVPWESSSLKGNFFFVPGTAGGQSAARPAAQQGNQAAAVQRAVEEANTRAAKEREAFQKRMEAMIATALEKQRAELDAARRERGEPPAPAESAAPSASSAPAPAAASVPARTAAEAAPALAQPVPAAVPARPAPAIVASIAPSPSPKPPLAVPATPPGWPQPGDVWVYQQKLSLTEITSRIRVESRGATAAGILEAVSVDGGEEREVVHRARPELVNDPFPLLSPYLEAFGKLAEGSSLGAVDTERIRKCTVRGDGASGYGCEIEVEVEGKESVSTPAGDFEAIRVDMVIYFDGVYGRPNGRLSYWYAPAAKRLVRATGRDSGSLHYGFDNFEIVLLAYQLAGQPPVGRSEVLKPAISGR